MLVEVALVDAASKGAPAPEEPDDGPVHPTWRSVEPGRGLEPLTCALRVRCSTG
jgi:hypothetical protein